MVCARSRPPSRSPLRLTLVAFVALLVSLAGTSGGARAAASGAAVTRVRIVKSEHTMELLRGGEVVARYAVALGPGGAGPKVREGDRVTPVGRYRVVSRHASRFRVFLALDYPNAADRARFERLKREGALPRGATIGGDIGIHGPPASLPDEARSSLKASDWTLGCIAVDDDEILEIARLVKDGTVVDIED